MLRHVVKALLFLVLANAPFWAASSVFLLQRPWVNLDGLAALLVARWSRATALALLVLVWLADAATALSLTFHFTSPVELMRSLRFGHAISLSDYAGGTALTLSAVGGIALFCAALPRWRTVKPAAVLIVGALAFAFDLANGTSFIWPRNHSLVPVNPTGSGLGTLGVQWARSKDFGQIAPYPDALPAEQLARLERWAAAHPEGRIGVVLVESLGAHRGPRLRAWLSARLLTGVDGTMDVSQGSVSFRGATTSGELRTLCALTGAYHRLRLEDTAGCLPRRLHGLGWSTTAMHGFTGRMFDRQGWWPLLGIDRRLFAEDLLAAGTAPCGLAFRGLCDRDLMARATEALRTPRSLVYALTLNTHLPHAPREPEAALAGLCRQEGSSAEVCGFVQSLGDVLDTIGVAVRARPGDTAWLVVGDHSPPFARPEQRAEFLATEVPYFLLLPRER